MTNHRLRSNTYNSFYGMNDYNSYRNIAQNNLLSQHNFLNLSSNLSSNNNIQANSSISGSHGTNSFISIPYSPYHNLQSNSSYLSSPSRMNYSNTPQHASYYRNIQRMHTGNHYINMLAKIHIQQS